MASKFGGMHAKDRMAMFEKKTETAPKKSGPRKIGKLNIGHKEEPKKEEVPFKKTLKKVQKKEPQKAEEKPKPEPPKPADKPQAKPEEKPHAKEPQPAEKPHAEPPKPVEEPQKTVEKTETEEAKPEKTEVEAPKPVEKPPVEPSKTEVKPTAEATAPKAEVQPKAEVPKTEVKPTEAPKPTDKPKTEPPKPEAKPHAEPAKSEEKPKAEVPKPAAEKPHAEPVKPEGKPKTEAKPHAEPPKPLTKQQTEPPKATAKPEPAVAKIETKSEPAKPKEVKPEPQKKKDEKPKAPVEPAKDKQKKEPVKAVIAKDIAEAEAAVKAAQDAQVAAQPKRRRAQYKPIPEEFYDNLFYFSGMGTVVGSALNKGVYVPTRSTRTALGSEVIEEVDIKRDKEIEHETYVIRKARTQAVDIAEELRKLQLLLGGLPSFGENGLHKIDTKPKDDIMHAHYFQPEHPPEHTRKHEVRVTLETKVQPPKAPQSQWPPPVVQPVQPVNVAPINKGVGVFTGAKPHQPSPSAWQEKYGGIAVDDARVPHPYGEGDIPGGLKPWELSRLRGLEAKGYHFEHQEPLSGADFSDSFYHGETHPEMVKGESIHSLAPFLVSGRSQSVDREDKLSQSQYGYHTLPKQTIKPQPVSPRPRPLGHLTPSFHGSHTSLPFSDL